MPSCLEKETKNICKSYCSPVRSLDFERQRGITGAASLPAHMDWFALSSPCKSSLPSFKPERTREGAAGWKCPLFFCMDYCAVSHSVRRKQLSRAQGLDSLPEAQLYPDLCCPCSGRCWLRTWSWRPPSHTFLPSLERKLHKARVPECFVVQKLHVT